MKTKTQQTTSKHALTRFNTSKKGMEMKIIVMWLVIIIIAIVLLFFIKTMFTSENSIVDSISGLFD
jgi:uncharacterized membrane protein YvbJ